jgi:hypothetical protein
MAASIQSVLYSLKKFRRNYRRMFSFVRLPVPDKQPSVENISQNIVNLTSAHFDSKFIPHYLPHSIYRVAAIVVCLSRLSLGKRLGYEYQHTQVLEESVRKLARAISSPVEVKPD